MTRQAAIGFVAIGLFIALWLLPISRALRFFEWSRDYVNETGSTDAAGDLRFAGWLLGCYLASLAASLVFAWRAARSTPLEASLPAAILIFAVVATIRRQPEVPIHLFPEMSPIFPVVLTFSAVAIQAMLAHFRQRMPSSPHSRAR